MLHLGKVEESLDQPENASVAEKEVEILTVPVDENLFLRLAVNSMCNSFLVCKWHQ